MKELMENPIFEPDWPISAIYWEVLPPSLQFKQTNDSFSQTIVNLPIFLFSLDEAHLSKIVFYLLPEKRISVWSTTFRFGSRIGFVLSSRYANKKKTRFCPFRRDGRPGHPEDIRPHFSCLIRSVRQRTGFLTSRTLWDIRAGSGIAEVRHDRWRSRGHPRQKG